MSNQYIDPTEVAKMVRQELKPAFPATKFSVRTDRYAGGSSIDVAWTDGPTDTAVENVAGKYHGASFDGMIDLKSSNGSPYGNDYIFFNRHFSLAAIRKAAVLTGQKYRMEPIQVIEHKHGGAWYDETDFRNIDESGGWNPGTSLLMRTKDTLRGLTL